MTREIHPVELVEPDGSTTGESTVEVAHRSPGLLHRAFSVLLVDGDGRLLLQRRAAVKTRFALRWANACCGHPRPGEPVAHAAERRLIEELGVDSVSLTEVGIHVYRASDPASGRVEHEYDHVLVGEVGDGLAVSVDPDEVAEVRWVHPALLAADVAVNPSAYAPWLVGVLTAWQSADRR